MNQFIIAWEFAYTNWKYFLMLILPVVAVESLAAYIFLPLNDLSQAEDFTDFISDNSITIIVVLVASTVMQISLIGGLWVSYMALDSGTQINPISALQVGLSKFFPLFGANIIIGILSLFGFILLIIPGIYLTARFALFGAQIMFEDNKVFESIEASWNKTDKHATKLFIFTLVFFSLIFFIAIALSFTIPPGIFQTLLLALVEYVFVIPLGYIYFTLYKSLRVSQDQLSK
tara:strand:+ start:2678 stop:3370 length:693 start_codon:yes stop_codon:yes gene_type:complete